MAWRYRSDCSHDDGMMTKMMTDMMMAMMIMKSADCDGCDDVHG